MRQTNFALAVMAAAVLAACGGSDNDTPVAPAKPAFTSQVSFGDSLSDVGTYKVGTVAALGGGTFTINGNNTATNAALTGKNWTQVTAAAMGLGVPCAAVTGLNGNAAQGFSVPIVNHPECTNYAEGGSRVSNPVGVSNALTGSPLGMLTIPVSAQIAEHLSRNGGAFSAGAIVTVMAGGNDAFMLLAKLQADANAAGSAAFGASLVPQLAAGATNPQTAAQAIGLAMATAAAQPGATSTTITMAAIGAAAVQPGNSAVASQAVWGPMVATATTAGTTAGVNYGKANGPALPPLMGDTGLALAALIKTQMLAKGAKHVVVMNIPDMANAPTGMAQSADTRVLINGMVSAFNLGLRAGLDGTDATVLQIDAFAATSHQIKNKDLYGYSNTTNAACGANALGTTSLVCTGANVIGGDISHYMFADDTHPTPYAHTLVAKLVLDSMVAKGWR